MLDGQDTNGIDKALPGSSFKPPEPKLANCAQRATQYVELSIKLRLVGYLDDVLQNL